MIYFIQAGENGPIKIGFTDNDIENRISQMQTGCPYELKLLWLLNGDREDERRWHERFQHENIHGEWFRPSKRLTNAIEEDAENRYFTKFLNNFFSVRVSETPNTVNIRVAQDQLKRNYGLPKALIFSIGSLEVWVAPKSKIKVFRNGLDVEVV